MRCCLVILGLAVVALAGCAGRKTSAPAAVNPAQPGPASAVVNPERLAIGRIVRVNPTARFAVVNFPVGRLPAQEQLFVVYRGGLKIGELRITGPHLDDNIVGDVLTGDVQPGDEVRPP